ncbi:YfhO family protein [Liquorilactobacillus mali]|nr:YfhO family protein [Liquorilactobacillus mali]
MKIRLTHFVRSHYPLILSFFLPIFLMGGYFISQKMFPFGKSSLLTVDLGQQYIDFFAYFRRTLLSNPSGFFYSFSKEVGGNMIGEWAYYLMSPFNLFLLLFPEKYLAAGVMLITLLKYGCAGLSFGYFLKKMRTQSGLSIIAFSTSYSMMGWFVANQLNLLWLDATIFLPLIALALHRLLSGKKSWPYIILLAIMLIDNYYMGYMICLFLILYFIWFVFSSARDLKKIFSLSIRFIINSLVAVAISMIILLPTIASLLSSKGQYTQSSVSLKFEYNALKMLSKFVVGSFNFQQMPSGYPNLFIGSVFLIGFILYFVDSKISLRERILSFLISIFLVLSLCFEPLDLLWHGWQFPVWYPYRFSYIVSFWMLLLASRTLKNFVAVRPWKIWLSFILYAGIIAYSFINEKKFSYVTNETLIFTAIFATLSLAVLAFAVNSKYNRVKIFLLCLISVVEISMNAYISLGNLSYLTQKDYATPTKALIKDSNYLNSLKDSAYRTGQTYSRTKNDGLANNLNTGSYFSSALEKSIPDFYGMLGNPDGDNYVTYSNGTIISDALLNMKYFITPIDSSLLKNGQPLSSLTEKPDLSRYKEIKQNKLTQIYKNNNALGYAYLANNQLKNLSVFYDNPIEYQTEWLNDISGKQNTKYFEAQNFNEVVFQNIEQSTKLTNSVFKKKDLAKSAQIVFKFTPKTNDSYYLTLGSALDSDNATLYLNNQPLKQYSTFRHTVIVNIANHSKGQEIVLTARLKKSSLWLNNFVLYKMNNRLVQNKINQIKKHSVNLKQISSRKLSGTYNASTNHLLATTIPYSSGWTVRVDGKKVSTFKIQNTFLAANVAKGKHSITLTFTPPLFVTGTIITLIGLALLLFIIIFENKKRRKM